MMGGARSNTVGRQQEVGRVLTLAPLDLVDLFLDLQTLQVVELRFMGLEFCMELVLASLFLFVDGVSIEHTVITMMHQGPSIS